VAIGFYFLSETLKLIKIYKGMIITRSSSRLAILNNCPICVWHSRIFAACHLWKCPHRVYWNLSYSFCILKVIFLKSNSFRNRTWMRNIWSEQILNVQLSHMRTKISCHRNEKNINKKFVWLKVASVNISYIMVDCVPLPIAPFLYVTVLLDKYIFLQSSIVNYPWIFIFTSLNEINMYCS
jgi:hypothetical protein